MQKRREKRFKPVLRLDGKIKKRIAKKLHFDKRGIHFDLPDWYLALLYRCTHCFYTGEKFTKGNNLTLERIDNDKGYIVGNVIPVCNDANAKKSNFDDRQIVEHIEKLEEKVEYQKHTLEIVSEKMCCIENATRKFIETNDYENFSPNRIKKLINYRKLYDNTTQCMISTLDDIDYYNLILTASSHYASMSKNGIMICLMYQQGFDPEQRFGVNI